jgi:hypothetical protein
VIPPVVIPPVVIPPVVVPPVIVPPVIVPPVIEPPVIQPPVVVPPVVDPVKPPVEVALESAKTIIANVSVAAKTTSSSSSVSTPESQGLATEYRLINLGMKLPDDMADEDGPTK